MGKSSLCLLAFLAVLAIGAAEELYPDTYDHIDPHDILNNDELRNEYYNCVMETGPCKTEEQKFMKERAAEAIATRCRRCTDKQKEGLEKVVEWYVENRPQEWSALVIHLIEQAKKMNINPDPEAFKHVKLE